ncbi:hypothetical protein QMK33_08925 [Hymenobacter sp. H14-R3]|uniref:hypothetical protein n=1 Tax=Hymenobacter sp. H14-R3 TaxID=3046308 RepID=UPI0024BB6A36|nr:hypothetical protein [Hymenobacter sp. H14-R3]MDJ0365275.1 hypothetical protein [Hymenobacter sp. H14-R3]
MRGKEQRLNYLVQPPANAEVVTYGTVAVIVRNGHFLVSIQEIKDLPGVFHLEAGYDTDELHTLPNLAAVEHLLETRLGRRLAELRPAKGQRHFGKE